MHCTLARLPLWPKIFSISCSFSENLAKSYNGAPVRVGVPSYGDSWIRPWNNSQWRQPCQRNIRESIRLVFTSRQRVSSFSIYLCLMFTISRCRWYVLTDVCSTGREGLVNPGVPLQHRRQHLLHAFLLLPGSEYTFDIGGSTHTHTHRMKSTPFWLIRK